MPIYMNKKDKQKLETKVAPKLGKPVRSPKKIEREFQSKLSEIWTRVLLPSPQENCL